jgi:hypothetical protein
MDTSLVLTVEAVEKLLVDLMMDEGLEGFRSAPPADMTPPTLEKANMLEKTR